jgi:hypothetical protein
VERNDLEGLIAVYEGGFTEIQSIIDDPDLTSREKVDEIADIVYGDTEEGDEEEDSEEDD